jgi:hypothetical protein
VNAATSDRRLARLANILDNVPKKKFDIRHYAYESPKCGTVGCALGHAAMDKFFQKLGLKLYQSGLDVLKFGQPVSYGIETREGDGFGAALVVFGLERSEGAQLFLDTAYVKRGTDEKDPDVTPKKVARKIRSFLRNRAKANKRKLFVELP